MSNYLITRVWREAPYKGTDLLVLQAMADAANDNGIFWHSTRELAAKTRLSPRRLREYAQEFEAASLLARYPRRGRSNIWQLTIPATWTTLPAFLKGDDADLAESDEADAADIESDEIPPHEGAPSDTPAKSRRRGVRNLAGGAAKSRSDPAEISQGGLRKSRTHNPHRTSNEPSTNHQVNRGAPALAVLEPAAEQTAELHPDEQTDTLDTADTTLKPAPDLWRRVREALAASNTFTKAQRENWLDRAHLFCAVGVPGEYVLAAHSAFAAKSLRGRFTERIESALATATGAPDVMVAVAVQP